MKLALTLLACTSLTTFVLLPDRSRSAEASVDHAPRVDRDSRTEALAPARVATEPRVLSTPSAAEPSFLQTVPFGPSPEVPFEKRRAVTGVPPAFPDVLPVVEWGIRTRGFTDFEMAVEAAKHRVAPAKVEHLLGMEHPQLERAREIHEAYLPRFEELAPEWAEAALRYRARVFEEGRYLAWHADQLPPAEASGSNACSTQVTNGWKIWFSWERGIDPTFDAVHERQAALNSEYHAQIDHLRSL